MAGLSFGEPIGTGAALANQLRNTDRVVISFFGDGGANQGVVHESMNLATVWRLPIVFLCENNQYALSTASTRTTAGESIAGRAAAYGIPGVRVDGNDVLAVYEAVRAAVERARRGDGPSLIEALTYRWGVASNFWMARRRVTLRSMGIISPGGSRRGSHRVGESPTYLC